MVELAPGVERVAALLDTAEWKKFADSRLAQVNRDALYQVLPDPEDFRREGTLIERLQMSQSEEESAPPSRGGEEYEVEVYEEVVEYVDEDGNEMEVVYEEV